MIGTIKHIIVAAVDNREALSKQKYSGIHKVDELCGNKVVDVYRTHMTVLLPKFIQFGINASELNKMIENVVNNTTFDDCILEWDACSLWFTIKPRENKA